MIHTQTNVLLHTQAAGTQLRDGAEDPIPLSQPHSTVTPKTLNRFLTSQQGSRAPGDRHQFAPRPALRLPRHRGPPAHLQEQLHGQHLSALPDGDIGVGTIPATHPGILQTQLLCRVITCSLWSKFRSLPQDSVPQRQPPTSRTGGSHCLQRQWAAQAQWLRDTHNFLLWDASLCTSGCWWQFPGHNVGLTLTMT